MLIDGYQVEVYQGRFWPSDHLEWYCNVKKGVSYEYLGWGRNFQSALLDGKLWIAKQKKKVNK